MTTPAVAKMNQIKHARMRRWLGCGALTLVAIVSIVSVSCSNHLGPVTAVELGTHELPNLPDITVDGIKGCMAEYGPQLQPGQQSMEATIPLAENGKKYNATISGVPSTAADFAACVRISLDRMVLNERYLQQARHDLQFDREEA